VTGVDWRALNRANWDSRVPVYLASSFYDLAGFRAGASTLRPFEVPEVGSVAGLPLARLQCHIGARNFKNWTRRRVPTSAALPRASVGGECRQHRLFRC